MKKWKVILDRFSPVRENGHREFKYRQVIATCNNRGDAELICHLLSDHYKTLTEIDDPHLCQYVLAVGY